MNPGDAVRYERGMSKAATYAEWSEAAKGHDIATGVDLWKESDFSKHFDYTSIRMRLERLSDLWKEQDNKGLHYSLNEGIHGNMDGMGHERLYRKAKFGTKALIEDYVDAIVNSLVYLASENVDDIPFEEKLDFFHRAQHCYGRSALMLSGSGAFHYFHIGVVKALREEGVLPRIISGSSGGSIVGAVLCTHKDEEIDKLLNPESLVALAHGRLKEAERGGGTLSTEQVRRLISGIIPDLTFQESYELTGRHLNVSIAPAEQHQTSRLLNAIASPNVFIREAVFASCAVPGVYDPVTLAAKDHRGRRVPYLPDRKWVDGSVTNDLPGKRLARLYGVNHHIVSQANPLVSPFSSEAKQERGAIAAVRGAAMSTTKAWLNASASLMQGPLSFFPRLNAASNIALSILNQDFTGDINIVRPTIFWSPTKLLSNLPLEDVEFLIDLGQRTAWPKIEMIRTQTKVSKVLEEILTAYEAELVDEHDKNTPLKRKLA